MEFNATFLVSIISFIVFMKIMNAIFYIPLTNIIEEREKITNKNYEESKYATEQAEELLKNKNERLSQTAKKSRQILIDKTNEANSDYHEQVNSAKENSNKRINEIKSELSQSEKEAENVLNSHVENLAQSIVDKVLQGGING